MSRIQEIYDFTTERIDTNDDLVLLINKLLNDFDSSDKLYTDKVIRHIELVSKLNINDNNHPSNCA